MVLKQGYVRGILWLMFIQLLPLVSAQASPRLSQLDFDAPVKATPEKRSEVLTDKGEFQAQDEEEAELLGDLMNALGSETKKPAQPIRVQAEQSRAMLAAQRKASMNEIRIVRKLVTFTPNSNAHLIIPPLRGVASDEDNTSAITPIASWQQAGGDCAQPHGARNICQKVQAAEELLRRFTGGEEFSDEVCSEACRGETEIGHVYGFQVKDTFGGNFSMLKEKSSCKYQLTKPENQPWRVLEVASVHCLCLPKTHTC